MLTITQVRKYHNNVLKHMILYSQGETRDTVFQKMKDMRAKHRRVGVMNVDHSQKVYIRDRAYTI